MTVIQYLLLKLCFFLFLAGDILLLAFGDKWLGVIILFSGLLAMWRLYRCPSCGHSLDDRVSLKEIRYCPYCGCDFHAERKR